MGKKGAEAYRNAYGGELSGAGQSAHVLLKKIEIWERVEELQLEHASKTALTAEEIHSFLRDVVKTPVGEIDENSPLCESVELTKFGRKIKTPSKLKALELAAQMQGMLSGGGGDGKPHVRLQLIASGNQAVAAQLDIM